jgi:uncharacterized tellurite resistance protein B-like protein
MDRNLIETLGKVIVAAAWADKKMDPDEINCLKDLLFQFQRTILTPDFNLADELWAFLGGFRIDKNNDSGIGIPAREMAKFEMYTESPVDATERAGLVQQLCEAIQTEEDKTLIIASLRDMVEADGLLTDDEQAVLEEIRVMIENVDTGIFHTLKRFLQSALQRRTLAVSAAPNREKYFEEFLRNKVYYEMRRRMDLGEPELNVPDDYLRKLGTIGGMMARVAQVDSVVLETEMDKMNSIAATGWGTMSILQTGWGLSNEAAVFVIQVAISEVSKNFDYLRMSRDFFDISTPAERADLLELLFAVANADGQISNDEFNEIRSIADYLLLSSDRVDEAYSKFVQ